jgi:hypothetical protein
VTATRGLAVTASAVTRAACLGMPYLDACLRLRLAGAQEASSSWAIPGRWPPRRGTRSPDHPSDGRWRRASAATRSRPTGAPIRRRRTPPHDAPSGRTCRLPYRLPPRPQTGATPGGAREHRADASPRFFLVGVERAPRVRDDGLLGAQGVDEQARAGVPKSIAAARLQIPRRHEVSWGCPGVSLNPRRARRRARVQSSPGPQRNASPPTRQLRPRAARRRRSTSSWCASHSGRPFAWGSFDPPRPGR